MTAPLTAHNLMRWLLLLVSASSLTLLLLPLTTSCRNTSRDPLDDLTASGHIASGPDGKQHALSGRASWYGERHHGRTTACGEPFDMYALTAAHKTLPFHTLVRVTELETRKEVIVRINDRGPYSKGRVIDLSFAAAKDLDLTTKGTTPVTLEVLQWGDGSRCAR